MNNQYIPNSGSISEYNTGAIRDNMQGKGSPHLIPPIAIRKIAKRYEDGAAKYGRHNWAKGMPLSRFYDAIIRHAMAWSEGRTDEDHLGAIGWNMASAAYTEEQIKLGNLPAELNDLPYTNN